MKMTVHFDKNKGSTKPLTKRTVIMKDCIKYSARASLALVGHRINQMSIWNTVSNYVHIKQKTVIHTPIEKLQDAFINIMAGGHGISEVNQKVKPDAGLSASFGRKNCADQSTISATLNACTSQNVIEMKNACRDIYRQYGRGYRHHYSKGLQILDADMSGMPAGRQGEGVEKGYFAKQKNKRGRQMGRVYASLYDEIVAEQLYNGKTQLNRSLRLLIAESEETLNLNGGFRRQTLIRVDGGGGNDDDINWLLNRQYQLMIKVTHWKRVAKLAASVTQWVTDPSDDRRQAGWVEDSVEYDKPTRQLAVRCKTKKTNGVRRY